MTLSAMQYSMIVIRNWLMNTEFQWLKWLHINLPTRATRLMPLLKQELLALPKFAQAVCNAQSFSVLFNALLIIDCLLLFWSLHCQCLFDLRLLVSPLVSINVFIPSSWHYFNRELLKHINVTVLGVDIGKYTYT